MSRCNKPQAGLWRSSDLYYACILVCTPAESPSWHVRVQQGLGCWLCCLPACSMRIVRWNGLGLQVTAWCVVSKCWATHNVPAARALCSLHAGKMMAVTISHDVK
jgi:hypothetical protein